MTPHPRLILPLLFGLLMTACAPAADGETQPQPAPQADHAEGDHPPTDDPPADELDQPLPTACPPEVGTEIAAVIAAQLDAFAADDYAGALALASRSFQAGTNPAAFRRLIEASFPQVADSREHRVLGCQLVAPRVAHTLVAVTGRDGSREELVYVLVEEDDGPSASWAVSAAVMHERGDTLTA